MRGGRSGEGGEESVYLLGFRRCSSRPTLCKCC